MSQIMRLSPASRLTLFFAAVCTPALAHADETFVDLSSRLEARAEMPSPRTAPSWVEIGASSWKPNSFALPARHSADVPFERVTAMPSVYANYSMPLLSGLKAKLGGNFLVMERSASSSSQMSGTETADFFSARIAAEYTPPALEGKALEPYIGAGILPTFAVTGRSSFDDGKLYFGVPGELTLGSRLRMTSIGIPWQNAGFDLGVVGTVGSVDHSSFAGFGINGGVRVSL